MAIGRPRKTSEQLKTAGAKPYKVAARKAEEDIAAGIKKAEKDVEIAKRGLLLDKFIAQVKQERDTFFERLAPSQTVCEEYFHETTKSVPSMKASDERITMRIRSYPLYTTNF